jgi:hypothetical protein
VKFEALKLNPATHSHRRLLDDLCDYVPAARIQFRDRRSNSLDCRRSASVQIISEGDNRFFEGFCIIPPGARRTVSIQSADVIEFVAFLAGKSGLLAIRRIVEIWAFRIDILVDDSVHVDDDFGLGVWLHIDLERLKERSYEVRNISPLRFSQKLMRGMPEPAVGATERI